MERTERRAGRESVRERPGGSGVGTGTSDGAVLPRLLGTIAAAIVALALLSLAACGDSPTEPGGSGEPITELPRALTAAEQEVLQGANSFGLDLLGVLAAEHRNENLFFSPLSASMALGMTLNGADGDTWTQMRDVLGFAGMEEEEINAAYATLLELLQGLDPAVTVEIANSVWYREGIGVDTGFLERVRTAFEAEVDGVDFGDPATVDRINDWVDEKTQGTIDKLVDRLPSAIVMLLMNAVYFNGAWTDAFDPDETRSGPFTRGDGSQVTADFMSRSRAEVRLGSWEGHRVLELPYGGEAYAMTVVLPEEGTAPQDVAADLDPAAWAALTGALADAEADVVLPKFELEWTRSLNGDLQALGMEDAFLPGAADFTRMVPGGGIWVDQVLQKSFVRVDEAGTVAAAVTGVIVVDSAPPSFRADRPFLFAIRERLSGTLLFLGIVDDPS
jgi:serpin B